MPVITSSTCIEGQRREQLVKVGLKLLAFRGGVSSLHDTTRPHPSWRRRFISIQIYSYLFISIPIYSYSFIFSHIFSDLFIFIYMSPSVFISIYSYSYLSISDLGRLGVDLGLTWGRLRVDLGVLVLTWGALGLTWGRLRVDLGRLGDGMGRLGVDLGPS